VEYSANYRSYLWDYLIFYLTILLGEEEAPPPIRNDSPTMETIPKRVMQELQ
jgi:hypothetical protein